MKHIGMMVAALWIAGGVMLVPGVAQACEKHGNATPPQAVLPEAKKDGAAQARPAQSPLKEVDELLTAKCQCGSKADCTCKKGQCECSKCKGRHRQVMDALRKQTPALKLEDARYDATAGVFI
jgi:hypothetical protein